MRGRFVVFEGLDGIGKSTQSKHLAEWLASRGERAVWTCEPTSGPIGSEIRSRLRSGRITPSLPFLFSGDRSDHVTEIIDPCIEGGKWVVCDRYYFSTIAYQSVDFDQMWLWDLNRSFPKPDMVIYMEAPVALCEARMASRGSRDAFETTAFLTALKRRYDSTMSLVALETNNLIPVARVDADGTEEEVFERVLRAVWQQFPETGPDHSRR